MQEVQDRVAKERRVVPIVIVCASFSPCDMGFKKDRQDADIIRHHILLLEHGVPHWNREGQSIVKHQMWSGLMRISK